MSSPIAPDILSSLFPSLPATSKHIILEMYWRNVKPSDASSEGPSKDLRFWASMHALGYPPSLTLGTFRRSGLTRNIVRERAKNMEVYQSWKPTHAEDKLTPVGTPLLPTGFSDVNKLAAKNEAASKGSGRESRPYSSGPVNVKESFKEPVAESAPKVPPRASTKPSTNFKSSKKPAKEYHFIPPSSSYRAPPQKSSPKTTRKKSNRSNSSKDEDYDYEFPPPAREAHSIPTKPRLQKKVPTFDPLARPRSPRPYGFGKVAPEHPIPKKPPPPPVEPTEKFKPTPRPKDGWVTPTGLAKVIDPCEDVIIPAFPKEIWEHLPEHIRGPAPRSSKKKENDKVPSRKVPETSKGGKQAYPYSSTSTIFRDLHSTNFPVKEQPPSPPNFIIVPKDKIRPSDEDLINDLAADTANPVDKAIPIETVPKVASTTTMVEPKTPVHKEAAKSSTVEEDILLKSPKIKAEPVDKDFLIETYFEVASNNIIGEAAPKTPILSSSAPNIEDPMYDFMSSLEKELSPTPKPAISETFDVSKENPPTLWHSNGRGLTRKSSMSSEDILIDAFVDSHCKICAEEVQEAGASPMDTPEPIRTLLPAFEALNVQTPKKGVVQEDLKGASPPRKASDSWLNDLKELVSTSPPVKVQNIKTTKPSTFEQSKEPQSRHSSKISSDAKELISTKILVPRSPSPPFSYSPLMKAAGPQDISIPETPIKGPKSTKASFLSNVFDMGPTEQAVYGTISPKILDLARMTLEEIKAKTVTGASLGVFELPLRPDPKKKASSGFMLC